MVDVAEDKSQECNSVAQKYSLLARLAERNITPTVTELEQPSAELLASCNGKIFSSYDDALDFVNGEPIPKTELQILQETIDVFLLTSLEVL